MRAPQERLIRRACLARAGQCLLFAILVGACDFEPKTTGEGSGASSGDPPMACSEFTDWDPGFELVEDRILELVNRERSFGAACGSQGSFAPAAALQMEDRLRCAARRHSQDMAVRDFFAHENPEGENVVDRVEQADYSWSMVGENIAAGQPSPESAVEGWMASDAHCGNIMNPDYRHIGVGYYAGAGTYERYFTQVFGRP